MPIITTPYGSINVSNTSSSVFELDAEDYELQLEFNNLSTPSDSNLFASNMWITTAENAPATCYVTFPDLGVGGAGQNAIIWVDSTKQIQFKNFNDEVVFTHTGNPNARAYFVAAFLPSIWKFQVLGSFTTNIDTTSIVGPGLRSVNGKLRTSESVIYVPQNIQQFDILSSAWGSLVVGGGEILTQFNFGAIEESGFYCYLYNDSERVMILHPILGQKINGGTSDVFLPPFSHATINKSVSTYWISSSSFNLNYNISRTITWGQGNEELVTEIRRIYSTLELVPGGEGKILNFLSNTGTWTVINTSPHSIIIKKGTVEFILEGNDMALVVSSPLAFFVNVI